MAAAAPKRVPSPWTWWCLQHQGGMLPLRECIGLKWPKGRWEIRRERARSSSRGNRALCFQGTLVFHPLVSGWCWHCAHRKMAVLRQLALLLWKNYTLKVSPGPRRAAVVQSTPRESPQGWCIVAVNSMVVSLVEAEGPSDSPGTPPAPAVFWDPDLAPLEDPVRECAQCHGLPGPVHPAAAPVLFLPATWG